MLRALPIVALTFLTACNEVAIKSFSDATDDVNENYALGKQLRDRCNTTNDIDHCLAWQNHKAAAEAQNPTLDYDRGLARWEAKGPY